MTGSWAAPALAALLLVSAPTAASTRHVLDGEDLAHAWGAFLAEPSRKDELRLRYPYERCFRRAASESNLPLSLLIAVARGESDFDANARSSANAFGLMQIQWPGTARHLGIQRLRDLYDPCTNVRAGARYLRELLVRYDGDLHLALAAYNYGPSRIRVNAGGNDIPEGARWYSGYIYRHLRYVRAGAARAPRVEPAPYQSERKLEVLVFRRPFRAEANVNYLEAEYPDLRLDWFRRRLGGFSVVLLYRDEAEHRRGVQILRRAGVMLD